VVLPGVGAFRDCITNLKKFNLIEPIKEFIKSGKYFLGICLGMHLLFEKSYEFGEYKGLGIIEGEVKKFENLPNLSIPHMGWNIINIRKKTPLLNRLKNGDFFYFAHSFYVIPKNLENIMTTTDYGIDFTSSINKDNVFGVQFHPEKSQKKGLIILENFLRL
jgi:glutamine amidotransferase